MSSCLRDRPGSGSLSPHSRLRSHCLHPMSAGAPSWLCRIFRFPKPIENGTRRDTETTAVDCTHLGNAVTSSSSPTNFPHLLTISSIVGRVLGSCCQQLSMSCHTSTVRPIAWEFRGISGLPPCEMRCATSSFFCPSNGILPVKTSAANIPKANTSAALDSTAIMALPLRAGGMISGASHLEVPTDPGVAATVKLGSELMGASPYSVKRAWPLWSMTTFACQHRISTSSQPRSKRGNFRDAAHVHEKSGRRPTPFKLPCGMSRL